MLDKRIWSNSFGVILLLISVNGRYTDFGEWSECSAECEGGTQTRTRTCTNPAPAHGGADCVGESSESRNCNTHLCPSKIIEIEYKQELRPLCWVSGRR